MVNTKQIEYSVSWHMSIEELAKQEWDALAEPMQTPLLEYEWLRQMEVSGSVTPENGWLPCHMTVRRDRQLVAAAPLYVKGHSAGEFVWDYVWADVASQIDVEYYPKLIGMSPATPAVGYRFLVSPDEDEETVTAVMLRSIDAFCEQNGLSGASFHFVDPTWRHLLTSRGYSEWLHQSYEWRNQGFASFEDYLGSFTKNQRRNIRRERRSMQDQGITIRSFSGEAIPEHFFPLMYRYYGKTNDQFGPWAARYLTRDFFLGLHPDYLHRLLFLAAFERDNKHDPVGMSFLLQKRNAIIGRYWGAQRMVDALHFNACYYSPIEWAIEHGVRSFDPGAGSSHKLRRGFFAVANYSLHRFRDPNLRAVMQAHIDEINDAERLRIEQMNDSLPLKDEYKPSALPTGLSPSRTRRPR